MKISLIGDSSIKDNLIRGQLVKESCEKKGIEYNQTQCPFDDNFFEESENFINKLGDIIIRSNMRVKEGIDLLKKRFFLVYIKEKIAESGKFLLNEGVYKNKYIEYKYFQYMHTKRQYKDYCIDTYIADNVDGLKKLVNDNTLKFPFIGKLNRGSCGKQVYLFKSLDDIESFVKEYNIEHHIFQNFIENDGDFRIIVLGGKVLGIIKRVGQKGQYLNNVSQGGSVFKVTDRHDIDNCSTIALEAAKIFSLDFVGVDVIRDATTGKYFLLEINPFPQRQGFETAHTDINVADELTKCALNLYEKSKSGV